MKIGGEKGSILMEGVIVLPLWLVIFGGIFSLGQKGVDYIRVKGAERFAAETAIKRTGAHGPNLPLAVTDAFADRGLATSDSKVRQKHERSYVLLASGQSRLLGDKMVNFFSGMIAQPLYDISPDDAEMPDSLSSSRKGTYASQHTNFLLARTPRSTFSRRNWDPSLIVDKDVWKFSDNEDDNNDYPKKWDETLETKTAAKDPSWSGYKVKDPYSRSSTYEGWSGKAIQDESN